MIESVIYKERYKNWPIDFRATYHSTPRELNLYILTFSWFGMFVGLVAYLELQPWLLTVVGLAGLVPLCVLAGEIGNNFDRELERNKRVFEDEYGRPEKLTQSRLR